MAGTSVATAAFAAKDALYQAALALWPEPNHPMLVCWGTIGTNIPDQYVEFHGSESAQELATMGPNRGREETVRLEQLWFTARWGSVGAAREAEEYTLARIRELEQHVRVTDTTLGGVVRHCFLVSVAADDSAIGEAGTAQGRLFVARTVFEAKVRITS